MEDADARMAINLCSMNALIFVCGFALTPISHDSNCLCNYKQYFFLSEVHDVLKCRDARFKVSISSLEILLMESRKEWNVVSGYFSKYYHIYRMF